MHLLIYATSRFPRRDKTRVKLLTVLCILADLSPAPKFKTVEL